MILELPQLLDHLKTLRNYDAAMEKPHQIVLASGYFDPLTAAHVRYLRAAKRLGSKLVVAVNGDDAAIAKKGFYFMEAAYRAEIVDSLKCVDYTIVWNYSSVTELIQKLRPKYFAKGGDRSKIEQMDQSEVVCCSDVKTEIVGGAGGFDKPMSSSYFINRAAQFLAS